MDRGANYLLDGMATCVQQPEQWIDLAYDEACPNQYPFVGSAQRQTREVSRTPSPPTPTSVTHRRGASRQAPTVMTWEHEQMQGMMQVPGSPHHAQKHMTTTVTYGPPGTDRGPTTWSEAPSPTSSHHWGHGAQNGLQAFFPAPPSPQGYMSCVPPPPNMPAPGWLSVQPEYAVDSHTGQQYLVEQSSVPYVDDRCKRDRQLHSLDGLFNELQARSATIGNVEEVPDDHHGVDLPVLLGTENGGPPSPCRQPSDESPRRSGLMYTPGELLSKGALLGGVTPHAAESGSEVMGFCLNSVPEDHSQASKKPVSSAVAWLRQGEDQASDTQDASASSSSAAAAPLAPEAPNDSGSSRAESNGPGGPGYAVDPGGTQDWYDEHGEKWADGHKAGESSWQDASARRPHAATSRKSSSNKEWLKASQAGTAMNGRAQSPTMSYRDQLRAVGIQSLMSSGGQQASGTPAEPVGRAGHIANGPAPHGVVSPWLNGGVQAGGQQVAYNLGAGPPGTHAAQGYAVVRPPQLGPRGSGSSGVVAPYATMPAMALATIPAAEVHRPTPTLQRPDVGMMNAQSSQRRQAPPSPPASQVASPFVGSHDVPNVGSLRHEYRQCKPCAFFNSKGCNDGSECRFCHLCDSGEKKRRKKERAALRRQAIRRMGDDDPQERWHSAGWS